MNSSNATASEGTATTPYREGVDLFHEQHYSAAKKKFEEIKSTNADFPFIGEYISENQNNINKGLDKGAFPWLVVILVVVGAAVVGVLLAVFLVILPKSKKKKQEGSQGRPAAPPKDSGPPAGDGGPAT